MATAFSGETSSNLNPPWGLRNPNGNEGGWSEESFSENSALLQPGIVESYLAQIAKSAFRNDSFNLWHERG